MFLGVGVFLVTSSFQAGNSIGVGISIAEANGSSPIPWIIVFNIDRNRTIILQNLVKDTIEGNDLPGCVDSFLIYININIKEERL